MDASSLLTPVVDNANMFQGKRTTRILNHFFWSPSLLFLRLQPNIYIYIYIYIYIHICVHISDDFLLYEDINDGLIINVRREQAQQQAPESNKSSSECTSLDGGSNRDDRYH